MALRVWLVPSEDDCKKINSLKNWGTADLQIEDGIIETYPHITVISFENVTSDDLVKKMGKRSCDSSFSVPLKFELELELANNVDSEDDFWRSAYMPISSIKVPEKIIKDRKQEILDFFGNSLNENVCKGLWGDEYEKEALDEAVISASKKFKYPHLSLVHTVSGGKDRSKREEIAKSLTPKVKAAFPDGKITVDRIWIVDCPSNEPERPDADGVMRMPKIDESKKEIPLNVIPGFVEAMMCENADK